MLTPLMLLGTVITLALGIGFFVFLIPLGTFAFIVFMLAKRLDRHEAITYSFVQYPFLILLIAMLYIVSPFGFEMYFIPSMVFVPNMVIGTLYFWFAKNKRWYVNVVICLITLAVTLWMFGSG